MTNLLQNNEESTALIKKIRPLLTWGSLFLFGVTVLLILYCSFVNFTSGHFTLTDYAKYVNMIWNCGHGQFFRDFETDSYLKTHLSFSLILLGPFFRLWDHPFLLSLLQWILLLLGSLICFHCGFKKKLPLYLTFSFLFFYAGNPFTQSTEVNSFHGIGSYFFLVPWIYHDLLFRKRTLWVPFLILITVREDSAFFILPMMLYFGIRDKNRMALFLAVLGAAYGFFACYFLFQWINGIPLWVRRPGVEGGQIWKHFRLDILADRLPAFLWVFLPVIPWLRKHWIPLLVFPSVAFVMILWSPFKAQYHLLYQYPCPLIVMVCMALLHSLSEKQEEILPRIRFWPEFFSFWFIFITLAGHTALGYLPFGGRTNEDYRKIHHWGLEALRAAQSIPKMGVLTADDDLASFCSNRQEFLPMGLMKEKGIPPDFLFLTLNESHPKNGELLLNLYRSGRFEIRFVREDLVIAKRLSFPKEKQWKDGGLLLSPLQEKNLKAGFFWRREWRQNGLPAGG